MTNAAAAPALIQEFPEIVSATRLTLRPRLQVTYEEKKFYEEQILYADNEFLKVFTFPMINGDIENALISAYSVVITEEIAKKYFGDESPLG